MSTEAKVGFCVGSLLTLIFCGIGLLFAWSSLLDEFEKVCPVQHSKILKTVNTLGRISKWKCIGTMPDEWACREVLRRVDK